MLHLSSEIRGIISKPNTAHIFINCIFYISAIQTELTRSSTVFSTHQKARHSIYVHQLHLLHISKPNIPYMFINCIFCASHTITYWGTL